MSPCTTTTAGRARAQNRSICDSNCAQRPESSRLRNGGSSMSGANPKAARVVRTASGCWPVLTIATASPLLRAARMTGLSFTASGRVPTTKASVPGLNGMARRREPRACFRLLAVSRIRASFAVHARKLPPALLRPGLRPRTMSPDRAVSGGAAVPEAGLGSGGHRWHQPDGPVQSHRH